MSYRLKALGPCTVFVAGASYRVEAGDPLHLSDAEANAILSGPYKNKFAVISTSDPEPAVPVREQSTNDGFFSNGTLATVPSDEDGIYAPVPDYDTEDGLKAAGAVVDPVQDVYGEYQEDGNKMLDILVSTEQAAAPVETEVAETEQEVTTETSEGFSDPVPPKSNRRRRAHHKDGTYKKDDLSTPDVNEAWIDSPEEVTAE